MKIGLKTQERVVFQSDVSEIQNENIPDPSRYREKNPKKELRSQLKLPYKFGGLRLIVFELSLI